MGAPVTGSTGFPQAGQLDGHSCSTASGSPNPRSLLFHLRQDRTENEALIKDVESSLFEAQSMIETKAELIALNTEMLRLSRSQTIITDSTDNLILHCILVHKRSLYRSEGVSERECK
ncbi:MAG: hypothetical protein GDA48_27215 [Hormoscilla sp. GM102CHS1]|nr:hypothetical protein [Hormoscilla sp. GM102CHS1]